MKKFIHVIIFSGFLFAFGCNPGKRDATTADSLQVPSATDTMPVLHPGHFDTSGTIKTPPVNDNNVIVPDTNAGSE